MQVFVVILLGFTLSAGSGSISNTDHGNLFYGERAAYLVFMAFHNNNQRCSGTIIEYNWILTARSCLTYSTGVTIYFGMGPGRYSIYVSSSQYVKDNEHLALVRVPLIVSSKGTRKVALPEQRNQSNGYENQWVSHCGWGSTEPTYGKHPNWLQCVNLQIMPNNECGLDTINERILCTHPVSGMSNCFSDAGNPLVTGVYPILVGLSLSKCSPGLGAKFARISSHLNWIREYTAIYH
ncbi:serine protease 1 [Drosophila madeirensis]|uniref:Serine protease 1 n=1 Tax=Drosophila madeirensis TaxID=30013 RepID=A0AAU9FNA9_DROMD